MRLWEEGLIYQGDYIVNWCPRCQTVLSDLEVEREERDAEFVYIKYGPLTLGTVRPETKVGDTGLAVHPRTSATPSTWARPSTSPRSQGTISMRVVADSAVDPKFGTGVIKVTPGHDPVDFEIGRRHELPARTVIGFDGRMTALAGEYAGLDRFEARRRIVEDMQALGLIDRIEPYRHAVGVCYRCKTVVEPLVSKQWYVRIKPLAEPAIKAVKSGRIKHRAARLEQDLLPLDGEHPRLVRSRASSGGGTASPSGTAMPTAAARLAHRPHGMPAVRGAGAPGSRTCSTRGSPRACGRSPPWAGPRRRRRTCASSIPTACLVTAFDILFFWVARMAMFGLKFMGDVPFRDVYIHALVRDAEGHEDVQVEGQSSSTPSR